MRKKNWLIKSLGLGLLSVWVVVVMATLATGSNGAAITEMPTDRLSLENDNK